MNLNKTEHGEGQASVSPPAVGGDGQFSGLNDAPCPMADIVTDAFELESSNCLLTLGPHELMTVYGIAGTTSGTLPTTRNSGNGSFVNYDELLLRSTAASSQMTIAQAQSSASSSGGDVLTTSSSTCPSLMAGGSVMPPPQQSSLADSMQITSLAVTASLQNNSDTADSLMFSSGMEEALFPDSNYLPASPYQPTLQPSMPQPSHSSELFPESSLLMLNRDMKVEKSEDFLEAENNYSHAPSSPEGDSFNQLNMSKASLLSPITENKVRLPMTSFERSCPQLSYNSSDSPAVSCSPIRHPRNQYRFLSSTTMQASPHSSSGGSSLAEYDTAVSGPSSSPGYTALYNSSNSSTSTSPTNNLRYSPTYNQHFSPSYRTQQVTPAGLQQFASSGSQPGLQYGDHNVMAQRDAHSGCYIGQQSPPSLLLSSMQPPLNTSMTEQHQYKMADRLLQQATSMPVLPDVPIQQNKRRGKAPSRKASARQAAKLEKERDAVRPYSRTLSPLRSPAVSSEYAQALFQDLPLACSQASYQQPGQNFNSYVTPADQDCAMSASLPPSQTKIFPHYNNNNAGAPNKNKNDDCSDDKSAVLVDDSAGSHVKPESGPRSRGGRNSHSEYRCAHCFEVLSTRMALRKHIVELHPEVGAALKTATPLNNICPVKECPYATQDRSEYDKHMQKHLEAGYTPQGKKRQSDKPLQRHRYGKEEMQCPMCPYVCTVNDSFVMHLRLHKAGQPITNFFSCVICGKDFFTAEEAKDCLTTHKTNPDPEKALEYVCELCKRNNFSTPQLKKMVQHRRMHSNFKPHLCMYCDYRAARRDNLRSHIRRMHKKRNVYADSYSPLSHLNAMLMMELGYIPQNHNDIRSNPNDRPVLQPRPCQDGAEAQVFQGESSGITITADTASFVNYTEDGLHQHQQYSAMDDNLDNITVSSLVALPMHSGLSDNMSEMMSSFDGGDSPYMVDQSILLPATAPSNNAYQQWLVHAGPHCSPGALGATAMEEEPSSSG